MSLFPFFYSTFLIYILFYFLTKQAMSNYILDIDDCDGGCCCCDGDGGCHLEGCGASYSAFVRFLLRKISVGQQVCSPLQLKNKDKATLWWFSLFFTLQKFCYQIHLILYDMYVRALPRVSKINIFNSVIIMKQH